MMRYPKLEIWNLGPIQHCEIENDGFTVLMGPQSQGKSTIARAEYFFRSVPGEFLGLIRKARAVTSGSVSESSFKVRLDRHLREYFLRLFGPEVLMPGTRLRYEYLEEMWMELAVSDTTDMPTGVRLEYCLKLLNYIEKLDKHLQFRIFSKQELEEFFGKSQVVMYIPAERHMVSMMQNLASFTEVFEEIEQYKHEISENIRRIEKKKVDSRVRAGKTLKPTGKYIMSVDREFAALQDNLEHLKDDIIQMQSTVHFSILRYVGTIKSMKQALWTNPLKQDKIPGIYWAKMKAVMGGEHLVELSEDFLRVGELRLPLKYLSSGQQAVFWPLYLMLFQLSKEERTFLVFEEPESNLYPDAQQAMAELLALFCHQGNEVLITTHSPYFLGTVNTLLAGGHCVEADDGDVMMERLKPKMWESFGLSEEVLLPPDKTRAYFVGQGSAENALRDLDGVSLIENELIDGVSQQINEAGDLFLASLFHWYDDEERGDRE